MGSIGEEKRIQALFCELRVEDQILAPEFQQLCRRIQTTTARPHYDLRRSLVLVTSLLVLIIASTLVLFMTNMLRQRPEENSASFSLQPIHPEKISERNPASAENKHVHAAPAPRKIATRKRTSSPGRDIIMHRALAISTWQSPTATFMAAPGESILNSNPQLNQSVKELQSFLPHRELKELIQ